MSAMANFFLNVQTAIIWGREKPSYCIHKNALLCNNSNNGHIHIRLLLIEFIAKKAWKALEEALEWQNPKSIIKGNFHMANCLDVILVLMQKALFAFDAFTRSTFWSGVKGSNKVYSSTKTKWKRLKLSNCVRSSLCEQAPFVPSFLLLFVGVVCFAYSWQFLFALFSKMEMYSVLLFSFASFSIVEKSPGIL